MNYAEQLIERIQAAPDHPRVGVLANELLREFERGYPIEHLRKLLKSEDEDIVATGVWIAGELTSRARGLLENIVPLLRHPAKKIRFLALGCLYWAPSSEAEAIALGVILICDPDSGVRWKALDFLSRASVEQLESALRYIRKSDRESQMATGLEWLLSSQAKEQENVNDSLERPGSVILQRYACVAAARLSEDNVESLVIASSSPDEDISQFAKAWLLLLPQGFRDRTIP